MTVIEVESSDMVLVERLALEVTLQMQLADSATQAAVGHWLAAGTALLAAREAGEFQKVYEAAGLKKSMASKLATVAGRFGTDPPETLPHSWTTLYELARVDDEVLDEAIESGVVGPDMTFREAQDLSTPRTDSDPDEGSTADEEPERKAKTGFQFSEDRDAAVFSVEKGRLDDALAIITAPGFRLTVEVSQDLLRALRPLEDARSRLLQALEDEVGDVVDLPPFTPPRRIIPVSDPRDAVQVSGTSAFEASQAPHASV